MHVRVASADAASGGLLVFLYRWDLAVSPGVFSHSISQCSAEQQVRTMDSLMASSIRDVFNSARNRAANDIKSVPRKIEDGIRGEINNIKSSINNRGREAISGAVQAGVQGVLGAASSAMHGDFSGAIDNIVNLPNSVASGVLGSLGSNLSLPGTFGGVNYPTIPGGSNPLYGIMQRSDPLTSTGWYCIPPYINSAYGASQLPWYYVEEANLPNRNIETHSIFREGRQQHFPDKYSVDSLRLGFYLDAANVTLNYLRSWQAAIIRPSSSSNRSTQGGGYLLAQNFKKSIFIFLIDPIKSAVVVYEYVECWPTNLDQLNLESASDNRLIQQVNFSVGDVFVNTLGVNSQILDGITSGVRDTIGSNLRSLASAVSNNVVNGASSILSRSTSFF